ncbi:MAG: IclR family transcriptional regulator [Lachnospiraceae bacterium]|nr:IclR family transcriptional regulator [Lachnospiraceae bacterium]
MEEKNPIQVADRIFLVIETLAAFGPMGLIELSKKLELNKSTVHRILNSLIFMGYVKQEPASAKYSLSFKIWEIANQVLTKLDIVDIARPYLKKLVELTGETVHLVQIEDINAVYIDKVESYKNSVRLISRIGKSIPLYCSAVGKALLANMDNQTVKNIWDRSNVEPLTKNTIVNFDHFLNEIAEVRQNGYSLDNEENEIGVRCIAACIKDYKGAPKYAFSISVPISRMDDNTVHTLSASVLETKDALENEWK